MCGVCGMFSTQNNSTMKIPSHRVEGTPSYDGGSVQKCTATIIYGFMPSIRPNLLSATRKISPMFMPVRQCHNLSSSNLVSNVHQKAPINNDDNKISTTTKLCQDISCEIMKTYAEVVKTVSRQLPKQLSQMIPPEQQKTIANCCQKSPQIIQRASEILPKIQSLCNNNNRSSPITKMAPSSNYNQNSRCPWRIDSQRHSNYHQKFNNSSRNNSTSTTHLNPRSKLKLNISSAQSNSSKNFQSNPKTLSPRPLSPKPLSPKASSPKPCQFRNKQTPPVNHTSKSCQNTQPKSVTTPRPLSQSVNNCNNHKVPENRSPKRNWQQPPRRRYRNKFWQTSPRVLSSNWRIKSPEPTEATKTQMAAKDKEIVKDVVCNADEVCCDRARQQSESSQASEDSWVIFERDSGCSYDSEVSSEPSTSDLDSDSETDSSDSEEEGDSPVITDSGHNSESEEELFLKVGDGDPLWLSTPVRLPPLKSSSRSVSSLSNDSDDSDDDWIVFQSDSEDESEDEIDGEENKCVDENPEKRRASLKRVRFAAKEDICYVSDDDDYRAARCGEWEEMARDRSRFKSRIASVAEVINPVLNQEHRQRVLQSRFSS